MTQEAVVSRAALRFCSWDDALSPIDMGFRQTCEARTQHGLPSRLPKGGHVVELRLKLGELAGHRLGLPDLICDHLGMLDCAAGDVADAFRRSRASPGSGSGLVPQVMGYDQLWIHGTRFEDQEPVDRIRMAS